jgi:hypothetical protein
VGKEQAIKLIRAIVEIGSERAESPGVPLFEPIMRACIAVAEHAEDLSDRYEVRLAAVRELG